MSRTPKHFSNPDSKSSPIGLQKIKNNSNIKSKSKFKIEGTIKNESCSTTLVDPKTVFIPYPNPKNGPLGPQKFKNDTKIK